MEFHPREREKLLDPISCINSLRDLEEFLETRAKKYGQEIVAAALQRGFEAYRGKDLNCPRVLQAIASGVSMGLSMIANTSPKVDARPNLRNRGECERTYRGFRSEIEGARKKIDAARSAETVIAETTQSVESAVDDPESGDDTAETAQQTVAAQHEIIALADPSQTGVHHWQNKADGGVYIKYARADYNGSDSIVFDNPNAGSFDLVPWNEVTLNFHCAEIFLPQKKWDVTFTRKYKVTNPETQEEETKSETRKLAVTTPQQMRLLTRCMKGTAIEEEQLALNLWSMGRPVGQAEEITHVIARAKSDAEPKRPAEIYELP